MTMEDLKKMVIDEFSHPKTVKSYVKALDIGLWESEKKMIERFIKKGKLLDLGCGTGRTTFPLNKMGYDVLGVDLTPSMIDVAKKEAKRRKVNIEFKIGDATGLDFKAGSFDNAIFSFNGWTQIPGRENRQKALEEVYRVLKPEGYFMFTAHVRETFGKYRNLWLSEMVKHYILKPFGYRPETPEYGDKFFERDEATQYSNKQFIHIASVREVKKMIAKAGFELMYNERRDAIAPEDTKLDAGNCMFYICKKQ